VIVFLFRSHENLMLPQPCRLYTWRQLQRHCARKGCYGTTVKPCEDQLVITAKEEAYRRRMPACMQGTNVRCEYVCTLEKSAYKLNFV
jgi:hypothetical protein